MITKLFQFLSAAPKSLFHLINYVPRKVRNLQLLSLLLKPTNIGDHLLKASPKVQIELPACRAAK